jgi:AbrB family looped-hinge helix DNA binding protein
MGEAKIDGRGRIVIPNEVRAELNLRPEQRLKISTKGKELIIVPEVGVDEFIAQLKGCIRGSKVRPEDLKQIWGVVHDYH